MSGPIDLRKLAADHKRGSALHHAGFNEALAIAGQHAKEHVRNTSKFRRRKPASLKDDTRSRVVKFGRHTRVLKLEWSKPYAPYIEYGTRPHRIVARSRGRLRFFSKKSGRIVFARAVNHPGTRPYKFAWNASSSAHRVLGKRLLQSMLRVASKF
jgi:G3E family GTPase